MSFVSNGLLAFLVASGVYLWVLRGNIFASTPIRSKYDFVIVGGGSAGAVLANRLSEDPKVKVLLIESGGSGSQYTDIPYIYGKWQSTSITWKYLSEPQESACWAQKDKRCTLIGGRTLGGGSTINFMLYVRGSPLDYNQWAQLTGSDNWSYKNVLPYFIKSEKNIEKDLLSNGFHGDRGPISVSTSKFFRNLTGIWLKAAEELGLNRGDYNGRDAASFAEPQSAITKKGKRASTQNSYLDPIEGRKNLDIICFSTVTRVIFDDRKRAIGVEFENSKSGKSEKVFVDKEVILSAGALGSPKILLASGVGPESDIKKLQIPLVADLPVGQNLEDHVFVPLLFSANTSFPSNGVTLRNYAQYLAGEKGILATQGSAGIGFITTNSSLEWDGNDTHIQYSFAPVFGESANETKTLLIVVILVTPKSRGYLKLINLNGSHHVIVNPKYLSHPRDLLNLRKGISTAVKLSSTQAFQRIGLKPIDTKLKECGQFNLSDNQYVDCLIKYTSNTGYHYCSTCRMGVRNDPKSVAVVDPNFRLLGGITGLRVVDASVFPQIIRGNTNAAVVMIAEKAAHIIKQQFAINAFHWI